MSESDQYLPLQKHPAPRAVEPGVDTKLDFYHPPAEGAQGDPTDGDDMPQEDPDLLSDLTAYFRMEESDVQRDSVVGGLSLQQANGTLGTGAGIIGDASDFPGDDRHIEGAQGPYLLNTDTDRSLSIWFKDGGFASGVVLGVWSESTPTDGQWAVVVTGGQVHFRWCDNSGVVHESTAHELDTEWNHVVVVYRSATDSFDFYYNGVLVQTQSAIDINLSQAGSTPFAVGGDAGSFGFAGRADELAVYDRALTSAEVAALYNGGAGFAPV